MLEVVVERSFESNVVGHEILTANIKARAFNLRAVDQTYADFFGALWAKAEVPKQATATRRRNFFILGMLS